jgi:uroporphyrinogen III methyltransferase / synthase
MREKQVTSETPNVTRSKLPLNGITVVVTRARVQSEEFTTHLEGLGACVIHVPTIEFAPPDSWLSLDSAIQQLAEYDWIVFTSANAVDFFFHRLRGKLNGKLAPTIQTCAIGPATARALETAGATANLVASDSRAEGALAAIIEYLGGEERLSGLTFLIPRARIARDVLPVGLRGFGARVDVVEAYQTVIPRVERDGVLRLFEENTIDAITFTSSSTVSNFASIVALEDLSSLLSHSIAFCIGPVTAETAERYHIPKIVHPSQYNSNALVDAIVRTVGRGE